MALTIETGGGVRGADAYAPVSFVTSYLTSLNRATAWLATTVAVQEAAIVAATSYIDTRWGPLFKSTKLVTFAGISAQAILLYTLQPSNNDIVIVGSVTYTYKTTLTTLGQFEIEIGTNLDATVEATIAIINSGDEKVTTQNGETSAVLVDGSTTQIQLTAALPGTSGNDIVLSITSSGNSVGTAFKNGLDFGSQPLQFPRNRIFDRDGREVIGIPLKLKQSMSEYADRARSALLYFDPVIDSTGRAVVMKREKVGPIETETQYEDGAAISQLIKPYPAADRLLSDYTFPPGRVFRG